MTEAHAAQIDAVPAALSVELPNRASPISRVVARAARTVVRPAADVVADAGVAALRREPRLVDLARFGKYTDYAGAVLVKPTGARRRAVRLDGYLAEWLWWPSGTPDPARSRDRALLYLHGGGFATCGLRTHRRMVARIALASRTPALSVAYRQLPDGAHVTQSIADAVSAYRWLLDQGFPARRIVVAGDSAGGMLAFMTALTARDEGLPVPGGIVAISPGTDLDGAARLEHPNLHAEPLIPGRALADVTPLVFGRDGVLDPAWSPVNHDPAGLPPVLIQVGSTEILRSDAERMAARLVAAGVPSRLQLWDRQLHVFQVAADVLPEARAAIREIGAFVQQAIDGRVLPQRRRWRRRRYGRPTA